MSETHRYLDGVPLRLSTKFRPRPRPHFKDIELHIPVDALQDEYDFSLERGVLVEAEAWSEEQGVVKELRAKEETRRAEDAVRRLQEDVRKAAEAKKAEEERLKEEARLRKEEEQKKAEEAKKLADQLLQVLHPHLHSSTSTAGPSPNGTPQSIKNYSTDSLL